VAISLRTRKDEISRIGRGESAAEWLMNRAKYGFLRHIQIAQSMNGQTEREHRWHRTG
jgi:hypothetical protein